MAASIIIAREAGLALMEINGSTMMLALRRIKNKLTRFRMANPSGFDQ